MTDTDKEKKSVVRPVSWRLHRPDRDRERERERDILHLSFLLLLSIFSVLI